jgi:hypothetical protein
VADLGAQSPSLAITFCKLSEPTTPRRLVFEAGVNASLRSNL